jgi:hypothetical protein
MPRLRLLKLHSKKVDGPTADALTPLWAAPWFSQLQELSLTTDEGFGGAGLAPLRAAPLLRKLHIEITTLGGTPALTAADGRALAAAALPQLRELQLYKIEPGFVAALATAPWLAGLELLWMRAVRKGRARGLAAVDGRAATDGRALAAAPLLSLKQLGLTGMGPGFMPAFSAADWTSRLERLYLRCMGGLLGGGGGIYEGSSAWAATPFTALVSLALSCGDTEPPSEASCAAALVAAPWFGRLQILELGGFPLGSAGGSDSAGLRALAAAPLPNLTFLTLNDARLSAADVSGALSSAPWLAALTSLSFTSDPLGAPGHRALSLLHLPRLRALSLDQTGIDGTGLAALVCATWLKQLANLTVEQTWYEPAESCENLLCAIEDDDWVFGGLRRAGCIVCANLFEKLEYASSDDELRSDELESDGEPGSDPAGDD